MSSLEKKVSEARSTSEPCGQDNEGINGSESRVNICVEVLIVEVLVYKPERQDDVHGQGCDSGYADLLHQ